MGNIETPRERLYEEPDPLAHLLYGESLVAAGNYSGAYAAYSTGINAARQVEPSESADTHFIIDCLHYSRAEAARLESSAALRDKKAPHGFFTLVQADLQKLNQHSHRAPIFDEPFKTLPEEHVLQNALTYLTLRTWSLLRLAQAIDQPQGSDLRLADAYNYFVKADAALLAGIMHEEPLARPALPPNPDDHAAYNVYYAQLLHTISFRRARRRNFDPQLIVAGRAAETLLNRRGITHVGRRRLPTVTLPDFCAPGPRISEIFDLQV